jgi:hypothetical protein
MDPKFIITPELLAKCLQFGKNSVGTSKDKYASRNQNNIEKIIKDIQRGKVAEQCVYDKLVLNYSNLSKPDFNIYEKKDKNWDPDLKDNDSLLKFAVKSQNKKSASMYGESYVFQIGNRKYDCDTSIFGEIDLNHYVCFVSIDFDKNIGEIRGIVKVQWLHDNKLFKPMQLAYLKSKVAVYYSDLEQYKNQLFQI